MPEPLTSWICDYCQDRIENAGDGIVIWRDRDGIVNDFRLVHRGRCDVPRLQLSHTASMEIRHFLEDDGLVYLLEILQRRPPATTAAAAIGVIADMPNFLDFFRRMQLPHYEEARQRYLTDESLRERYDAEEFATLPHWALLEIAGVNERRRRRNGRALNLR